MSTISKGMTVVIISGGPPMAVSNVGDYSHVGGGTDEAVCIWLDDKKIRHEERFDVAILKEYKLPALGSVRMTRG